MPSAQTRSNRGPAAAASNRAAILASARELFAERGYQVPLQAIARRAGVGQGVLYRHFPQRALLALAVFEQNFQELEQLSGEKDAHTFERMWNRLLEMVIESAAFVEMAVEARRTLPDYDGPARLAALVAGPLELAREAGLVAAHVTVDDVLVGLRMAYGIVVTGHDDQRVDERVRRALGTALFRVHDAANGRPEKTS